MHAARLILVLILIRGSLLVGRSPLLATLASAFRTLALSVHARAFNPGC